MNNYKTIIFLCAVLLVFAGRLKSELKFDDPEIPSGERAVYCRLVGDKRTAVEEKVFLSEDNKNFGYMNIGLWCSKNFKNGMVIGSSQTGAIGFFAPNLKVVNLDGVVSKACYESILAKTNIEYIKENKIEAIIGWQQNLNFIKNESKNFKDSDLTVLGSVPGIKTRNYEWYICKVNY